MRTRVIVALSIIGCVTFWCGAGFGWNLRPDTPCPKYATVDIETQKGNHVILYIEEKDIARLLHYSPEGISNLNFRIPSRN